MLPWGDLDRSRLFALSPPDDDEAGVAVEGSALGILSESRLDDDDDGGCWLLVKPLVEAAGSIIVEPDDLCRPVLLPPISGCGPAATCWLTLPRLASIESTRLLSSLNLRVKSLLSSLSNVTIWLMSSPGVAGTGLSFLKGERLLPPGGGVSLVRVPPGVVGSSLMAGCLPSREAKLALAEPAVGADADAAADVEGAAVAEGRGGAGRAAGVE